MFVVQPFSFLIVARLGARYAAPEGAVVSSWILHL